MDLDELRRHWDAFGADDPLWAVLTHEGTRGGRWDLEEFFAHGRDEVRRALDDAAAAAGGRPWTGGRALDLGCGVGRVTQALAEHVARVDGYDVSAAMLEQARRLNRHGDRVRFHLTEGADLRDVADASVDLAYTVHVLQHMELRYQRAYLAEVLRVLRPGGLAVVEVVTERVAGHDAPLPASALQARVEPDDVPALTAGDRHRLDVRATNLGDATWPAVGRDGWFQVSVAARWRDAGGALLDPDAHGVAEHRAGLPRDVEPGATALADLEVRAPERPGDAVLEVDLVQEGVAWFADHGSTPARLPVAVRPAGPADAGAAAEAFEPVMEMHPFAVGDLTALADAHGADVLDVVDWHALLGTRSVDWERRGVVLRRR